MSLFNRQTKKKKLFIPLGFLSLTFLSIWGFNKISKLYIEKISPEHSIEILLCCQNYPNSSTPYEISRKRLYKNFILTPDTSINRPILELAKKTLNLIKKNCDTINGIDIIFNDSTKYMDFIKALDYCYEKFPVVFATYNNHIWAFYVYVDTLNYPKDVLERKRKKGEFDYDK